MPVFVRPLLRGERLRLTAHAKDDIPTILRWYEDSEFVRLLEGSPARPQTTAWAENVLDEAEKSSTIFRFGVRLLADDRLIGLVALDDVDWQHGAGWVAIGIGDPDFRGKGYGTEALALLLDFAFHELNLHRVQLTVFSYNPRAIASYEKLGFVREGIFRERIHRDGVRHDLVIYGLLRREWVARQTERKQEAG